MGSEGRLAAYKAIGVAAIALGAWFVPTPAGLTTEAWHLFILFSAAIVSVLVGALPVIVAALSAGALAVITGSMSPADAYAGFSGDFILLILVAFLIAGAVMKCGLGERIGLLVIRSLGRSTLGLSYSLMLTDALIAPAFPSNTARSGVLFPLADALSTGLGLHPEGSKRLTGAYLMMSGIVSLSISSALWLTAMAANPVGAAMAAKHGVDIDFADWLIRAAPPCLLALLVQPLVLFAVIKPELRKTPEAPAEARARLAALGGMSRPEKITAATFVLMVAAWAAAGALNIDKTAVGFLGLAILVGSRVLTIEDLRTRGDALETFIWFAILYAMSRGLDQSGFTGFIGQIVASSLTGFGTTSVFVVLVVSYVLIHYMFVSQTAHLIALLPVFLSVGVTTGVAAEPLAFSLLFATNYFSPLTPQASSSNILFVGSGFMEQREIYRFGGIATAVNLVIFLTVGSGWLWLLQ